MATTFQTPESRYSSNASFTGALSYTTAMVFMIPLKSYIESQDFSTLAALFNASAIPTTPLQKVQYSVLQKDLEQARPWTEFGVSANGGMITTPAPNTSYLSPLVLNYHPLARGSVVSKDCTLRSYFCFIILGCSTSTARIPWLLLSSTLII